MSPGETSCFGSHPELALRTALARPSREEKVTTSALAIALGAWVLLLSALARAQPPEGQMVLNNESVRVSVLTFRPGAGTGRHLGLESMSAFPRRIAFTG
jgi:hypothetical protein